MHGFNASPNLTLITGSLTLITGSHTAQLGGATAVWLPLHVDPC
jgi:hypothetical protein